MVKLAEVDLSLFVRHKIARLTSEPRVLKCYISRDVRPWFSVLSNAMDFVLFVLNYSEVVVPGGAITLVSCNIEALSLREILHGFRNVVEHLAGKIHFNSFHVGRYLEIDDVFAVIFNFHVIKVLGYRDIVDIIYRADCSFCILQLVKRSLPSIDEKLRPNDDLSAVSDEDLFSVEVKCAIKRILLSFSGKLTHLGESAMLHNNLVCNLTFSIRNKNSALFLISLVEFLLEVDSCLVVVDITALANLLLVVEDVKQVASYSGSEDQRQRAFLNNSTSTAPIAHEFYNKQAHASIQLREVKFLSGHEILGQTRVIKLFVYSAFDAV